MISLNKGLPTVHTLLSELERRYPQLQYAAGNQFSWSPENSTVSYKTSANGKKATWSLLHETGHALLEHKSYKADFELIKLEIAAWEKAKELAGELGIAIDNDHIEDCLDTYRDWLYKRSICPTCTNKCLQQDDYTHYRCFNCHTVWRVSTNRFCRAYRRSKNVSKATAIFQLESAM
jgi:hypothetical protein